MHIDILSSGGQGHFYSHSERYICIYPPVARKVAIMIMKTSKSLTAG